VVAALEGHADTQVQVRNESLAEENCKRTQAVADGGKEVGQRGVEVGRVGSGCRRSYFRNSDLDLDMSLGVVGWFVGIAKLSPIDRLGEFRWESGAVGETSLKTEEGVQTFEMAVAVVLVWMSYCDEDPVVRVEDVSSDLDLDMSLGGVGWFVGGVIPFPIDRLDSID